MRSCNQNKHTAAPAFFFRKNKARLEAKEASLSQQQELTSTRMKNEQNSNITIILWRKK